MNAVDDGDDSKKSGSGELQSDKRQGRGRKADTQQTKKLHYNSTIKLIDNPSDTNED